MRLVNAGVLLALARSADAQEASSFLDQGQRLGDMAEAFVWANSAITVRGDGPLFCQPRNLGFTDSQVADILRRYLKQRPELATEPVGGVLLLAMQHTFPC